MGIFDITRVSTEKAKFLGDNENILSLQQSYDGLKIDVNLLEQSLKEDISKLKKQNLTIKILMLSLAIVSIFALVK